MSKVGFSFCVFPRCFWVVRLSIHLCGPCSAGVSPKSKGQGGWIYEPGKLPLVWPRRKRERLPFPLPVSCSSVLLGIFTMLSLHGRRTGCTLVAISQDLSFTNAGQSLPEFPKNLESLETWKPGTSRVVLNFCSWHGLVDKVLVRSNGSVACLQFPKLLL